MPALSQAPDSHPGGSPGEPPGPTFTPTRKTGEAHAPSGQKTQLKTCHLSASHPPKCRRAWPLRAGRSKPTGGGRPSPDTPPASPPALQPRVGGVSLPHPSLGRSWHTPRAELSVSDVRRLLSAHKDWKLSLLSPGARPPTHKAVQDGPLSD